MIQKTDWGYIKWLHTSDNENGLMNIGITVVYPYKTLPKHTHYGTEQFLYVLEGEGYYLINDVRYDFKKGDSFYLESDATHVTVNTSDSNIKEFLVSTPVQYYPDIFDIKAKPSDDLFYDAVHQVHRHSLNNLKLPYTIMDKAGNIIIQNDFFPDYCLRNCLKDDVECLNQNYDLSLTNEYVCSKGIVYYRYPIQSENVYLGAVIGGHIKVTEASDVADNSLFDTTKSNAISIQKILKQLAKNISNNYEFNVLKKELISKDQAIDLSYKKEMELEKNIVEIEKSVINLKINNHFLFNTLNSMASLALQSDNIVLYESIISLAKIFRYTIRSEERITNLKEELNFIEDYLNLQKIRYLDKLVVNIEVDASLFDVKVPFNFLQPIVENTFTHGFSNENSIKKLDLLFIKDCNQLKILIINNGTNLIDEELELIKTKFQMNTDHGLSLIYEKLKVMYGEDFIMDVRNTNDQTIFEIRIPIILKDDRDD